MIDDEEADCPEAEWMVDAIVAAIVAVTVTDHANGAVRLYAIDNTPNSNSNGYSRR